MLLKYLDLQGFKSFPDKTRVTFNRGLTAVVGPNGSGKSNISDAIRWVMGEQSTKTLRGDKMEDVIFTGTKTRKSVGFAEVSLTVDNSGREFEIDSDEVTFTRKYHRSGESEYMINRANVRLKDINELFMDTGLGKDGYSLVGQGKISEIVRSKSNERREIFEEAAGISKYRYRKNEAERNLSHAEENLVRLRDILAELEGRIAPLKEQSDKAKDFIELSNSKKTLEVSIWNDSIERSNLALKDQSDKIIVSKTACEEFEKQIEAAEIEVQETFANMQNCLVKIDELRRDKSEQDEAISDIHKTIAVLKNDILHNQQNVDRIDNEMENYQLSTSGVSSLIEEKNAEILCVKRQIAELDLKIMEKQEILISNASKNINLSTLQQALTDELNQLILQQSQEKMAISQLDATILDLTASIERNNVEHSVRIDELSRNKSEGEQSRAVMELIAEKLESLGNSCSGHKLKLDNRKQKLEETKLQCEKSDLKIKEKLQKVKLLDGLEKSLDGFAFSVKEVLKRANNGVLNGILGSVSQIIDVKSEFSVAIETCLGGSMQNLITDNESNAKVAIKMLQQQNLGRATFLPLTSISGTRLAVDGLERYSGYIDIAANLVTYQTKFAPIIDSLLGRTVIVDDIDTAVLIAQKNNYRFKIVTLDGQVVNAGGSLTGGSKNKGQNFLSRKSEIIELEQQIAKLTKTHGEDVSLLGDLQNEVSMIKSEFNAINSEILTLNEDKIRLESEQKRLAQMNEQLTVLTNNMEVELQFRKNKRGECSAKIEELQISLKNTAELIGEKSFELEKLEVDNRDSVVRQAALADELNAIKIVTIEKNKDIEALTQATNDLLQKQQDSQNKLQELSEQRSDIVEKNGKIEHDINSIDASIVNISQKIEAIDLNISVTMERRNSLEEATVRQRKNERLLTEQKEKASSQTVRLEERLYALQKEYDEILKKLWDEYELVPNEAQNIAVKLESITKANSELNAIKSKIKLLGSVNVAAIEEYIEVSERFNFLDGQVKDSQKARNELLRLISELTAKMQDIFLENFNLINQNFKEIFVELFGGGRADLKLTDPENILETGIEIFVEPPGKIIKNLASLSGGEQSFIAIAIYFAILKVRPAPFCVLDEIEAALDDVNVVKYANYLHRMSDKTQFIMITHRRGSMEAADVLYGVTMQEEGVSKLLKLKASEIENSLLSTNNER